jgi:hypothetical protein
MVCSECGQMVRTWRYLKGETAFVKADLPIKANKGRRSHSSKTSKVTRFLIQVAYVESYNRSNNNVPTRTFSL